MVLHLAFPEVKDTQTVAPHLWVCNANLQVFHEQLAEFEEYMDFYKEKKEGNVIGFNRKSDLTFDIDEAMHKIFWLTKQKNVKQCNSAISLIWV